MKANADRAISKLGEASYFVITMEYSEPVLATSSLNFRILNMLRFLPADRH